METDWHKFSEIILNAAKIIALGVAGCWTYYQWNTVLFPEAKDEQNARLADQRPDLRMTFEAVKVQGLGEPFQQTTSEQSRAASGDSTAQIVQISGLILLENTRSFPIRLVATDTSLVINTGIEIDAESPLQRVTYSDTERLHLESEDVFGRILDDELIIESGGVVRLAYRAPILVQELLLLQPHEYAFGVEFELSAVGRVEDGQSNGEPKTKRALSSILVNGPLEVIRQSSGAPSGDGSPEAEEPTLDDPRGAAISKSFGGAISGVATLDTSTGTGSIVGGTGSSGYILGQAEADRIFGGRLIEKGGLGDIGLGRYGPLEERRGICACEDSR